MQTRTLGRSGIEVSALGLGCWAIGGPFSRPGHPVGWGDVDDNESTRAIHRALDLGVTFFDTADVYGCGHSERVLGKALHGRRAQVVIATKFGRVFDEETKLITAQRADRAFIRERCEDSLRRLNTDYIDLYLFHNGEQPIADAPEVRDTLEELVADGKIRTYGWSTDDVERARLFAQAEGCSAVEMALNLFGGNTELLRLCGRRNLAAIARSPLAMGMLTGKFAAESKLPENDVRHGWDFSRGDKARQLETLEQLRAVLTAGGRTLAQAALGYLWALNPAVIPIPGFKTVAQVEENVRTADFGPLTAEQMKRIDTILGR